MAITWPTITRHHILPSAAGQGETILASIEITHPSQVPEHSHPYRSLLPAAIAVAPIKGAFSSWGVPTTRCFVTQRFCRYPNQHLLFETSQTNLDIPYVSYSGSLCCSRE